MRANPFQLLDSGIELSEDFLNDESTYSISFDGVDTFLAQLEDEEIDAPKELKYVLTKPMSDFTIGEQLEILNYRGLALEDGFEPMDVFIHKKFTKLISPLE